MSNILLWAEGDSNVLLWENVEGSYLLIDEIVEGATVYRIRPLFDVTDFGLPRDVTLRYEIIEDPVVASISATANTGTTVAEDAVLSVSATASGNPTPTLSYEWRSDVSDNGSFTDVIPGATEASYQVSAFYSTHDIMCIVTANNDVGQDTKTSFVWSV